MNMTVATAYKILSNPHLNSPYAVKKAEELIEQHLKEMKENDYA